MKKYIKPVLSIATEQLEEMIAASLPDVGIDQGASPLDPGQVGIKNNNDSDTEEDWSNGLW